MSSLVFPTLPGCDIKVSRAAMHQVARQQSIGGKVWMSTWWSAPLYRYTLTFNFLRSASTYNEFQKLFGFFARHLGPLDSFLWVDPEDYTLTAHPFSKGDGTTKTFQLQRSLVPSADLPATSSRAYWPSSGDGYEPIYEPDTATDTVYVNGTPTTITHGANGQITFTTAPASGAILTWTGTYKKRVRFASDTLSADRLVSQVWQAGSLTLESVKP